MSSGCEDTTGGKRSPTYNTKVMIFKLHRILLTLKNSEHVEEIRVEGKSVIKKQ